MTELDQRDDDLRETFAAARRAEAASTPPFERVRAGRRSTGAPHRWRYFLVPAAVAMVTAVVVVAVRSGRPETPDWGRLGIGQLRSPTDFLLEVNGAENLSTVPSIGSTEGWFPKAKDNHL